MKNIYLLGASGSIGTQVLDCIDEANDFRLVGFSVNSNLKRACEIIEKYKPEIVCLGKEEDAQFIKTKYDYMPLKFLFQYTIVMMMEY